MNEDQIRKIASEVYFELGTQYGVASIPTHSHNNIDTNSIPALSVNGFQALSGKNGPSVATSGVLSPKALGNQGVAQGSTLIGYGYLATGKIAQFITFPVPIIYGHGVGVDSAFNGGIAPAGTILLFNNPGTSTQLWANIDGTNAGWHSVTLT